MTVIGKDYNICLSLKVLFIMQCTVNTLISSFKAEISSTKIEIY